MPTLAHPYRFEGGPIHGEMRTIEPLEPGHRVALNVIPGDGKPQRVTYSLNAEGVFVFND